MKIIVSGICKGKNLTKELTKAFIAARHIYTDRRNKKNEK